MLLLCGGAKGGLQNKRRPLPESQEGDIFLKLNRELGFLKIARWGVGADVSPEQWVKVPKSPHDTASFNKYPGKASGTRSDQN
jgi:hypothetical protein